MTSRRTLCSKLYNRQIVSNEGFTQKTTASVAMGNCLNDHVGVDKIVAVNAPELSLV
jgi:hypothetical protein